MSRCDKSFTYSPLRPGEIRLLHVSFVDDEAVWYLRTTSLDVQQSESQVVFDALSYTWGDLSQTFTFVCNDKELRVHQNLKDALPYLARHQSSLPIWVDALCINQSDNAEKLAQIRLMHSIYSRANQVWVWLGCALENSKEAIALLPRIVQVGKELEHTEHPFYVTPESQGLPSLYSPLWLVIYQLIHNPWFLRLWTMQEAALARQAKVLYGSYEIDWNILEEAIKFGMVLCTYLRGVDGRRPLHGEIHNYCVCLIRQVVQNRNPQVPWQDHLLHMLTLTLERHQCSNPHDRVLGVLGFMADDQIEQIGHDDNLPLLDLYTRFSHFLLCSVRQSESNWWKLFHSATAPKKLLGLPSWCPDFHALSTLDVPHVQHLVLLVPHYHYKGHIPYYASRGTSFPSQSSNLYELKVRGKIFDTVDRVYPQFPHSRNDKKSINDFFNELLAIRIWERALAKAIVRDPLPAKDPTTPCLESDGDDILPVKVTLDDYWRTLVGNLTERTNFTITCEMFCEFRRTLDRWAKWMNKFDWNHDNKPLINQCAFGADGDPEEDEEDRKTFQVSDIGTPGYRFLMAIKMTQERRRLFTTSQGRLGFGPETVQNTDVVCIMNYARPAHILRPKEGEGARTYKVLGEAYVHGMMTGEVETLGLEEQDIVLV